MENEQEGKRPSAIKTLLAGSILSIAGTALCGVFNYLLRRTLALELPPSAYGFVYSVISLAMMGFVLTDLGMAQTITIETAKAKAAGDLSDIRKLFSNLYFVKLIISIVFFAAGAIAFPWLMPASKGGVCIGVFILLWSLSAFNNLENISKSALIGLKEYKALNICEVSKVFATLLCIWLAVGAWGLYAPSIFMPLFIGLNAVVLLWLLARHGLGLQLPSTPAPGWFGRLVGLLGWMAASSALLAIPGYTDTLALTFFHGLESVALYNIAIPVMQLVQGFLMIFPLVFLPIASELWKAGDIAQLKRIYSLSLLLGAIAFFGGIAFFAIFGRSVITLLFSSRFVDAAPAAVILIGGIVLFALGNFFIQFLNSGGRQREAFYVSAAGVAVNIAGHLTLTAHFGINGAAITTATTYLVVCVLASTVVWRSLRKG